MANTPFSLLVKPASADCNLRCSYCFYIDHQSMYPGKIHRMSDEVLEKMIGTYMKTNQPAYSIGWQGGEPTLMGVDFYRKVVELQEKYGKLGSSINNGLQTNSILIDDEFAKFLGEYKFLVGVSLDGPQELHDKYRVKINGEGTYKNVMESIERLRKHKAEFNILTLVNNNNVGDARKVYNFLKDNNFMFHQYIPCVEFDDKGNPLPFTITGKEWGRFLIDLFDEWVAHDTRKVSIRLFDSIISFMINGMYSTCHLAGNCCHYFVVEHNGDVFPCDFFVMNNLKVGNIFDDSWEEMQNSNIYQNFGALKWKWNDKCSECKALLYCSGDCLKHRIYANKPSTTLSWLCEGWEMFYEHTEDEFKKIALSVARQMYGKNAQLFIDRKFSRNDLCFCRSGNKYKKCHGRV